MDRQYNGQNDNTMANKKIQWPNRKRKNNDMQNAKLKIKD
jgi:hypothetical protein